MSFCRAFASVGRLQGQLLRLSIGIASRQLRRSATASARAPAASTRNQRSERALLGSRQRSLSTIARAALRIGDLVEMEVQWLPAPLPPRAAACRGSTPSLVAIAIG